MASIPRMQAAFLSLFLVSASASAAPDHLTKRIDHRIDGDVKTALKRFDVPGAAVMVIRNGRKILVRTFGWRDVERRLPVVPTTFFEIGSLTKQFTAASIMQLREAGKLQIDRPLSDYLPSAPYASEVTLRQLLTHTSGLHDYLDGPAAEVDKLASHPASHQDLIARVGSLPLDFPPGSRWSYSNTGYLLLGMVIEEVSGEPYPEYLKRHILDPLGMKMTYTTADEARLQNMAVGYRKVAGKLQRSPLIDPSWGGAAGFLIAPLGELTKWDAALREGKIVSPESYREMTTPFMTSKNGSADYGFGLFVDSVYGEPRIGHTGGTHGFTAADEYYPRENTRIIALTNLGDATPEPGETLTNIIFADLYPTIAARAQTPARGEDPAITRIAREAFRELQTGRAYVRFGSHLKEKLGADLGARLAAELGPYGKSTAVIFKGIRRDGAQVWYDYMMHFGKGVFLPFAVRIGDNRAVAAFSIG